MGLDGLSSHTPASCRDFVDRQLKLAAGEGASPAAILAAALCRDTTRFRMPATKSSVGHSKTEAPQFRVIDDLPSPVPLFRIEIEVIESFLGVLLRTLLDAEIPTRLEPIQSGSPKSCIDSLTLAPSQDVPAKTGKR